MPVSKSNITRGMFTRISVGGFNFRLAPPRLMEKIKSKWGPAHEATGSTLNNGAKVSFKICSGIRLWIGCTFHPIGGPSEISRGTHAVFI